MISNKINCERRHFLNLAVMALLAGPLGTRQRVTSPRLPTEGQLPSLDGGSGWLNSEPLTTSGLRSKVVLIDFCTYTCINWQRQLPYVRAWNGKYKEHGLVVIGVHTPEFSFEKKIENVCRAVLQMRVEYPVVIDNNYAIWRAFDNAYWPALYFADANGRVRHHVFGEGEYEQSEQIIEQLLMEAGKGNISHQLASVEAHGSEAAADWSNLRSDENYVGFQRTQNFASPGGPVPEKPHVYSIPAKLKLNQWALRGGWTMQREALLLNQSGGRIAYRFHARDLHLVMGPGAHKTPVRFRVLLDGQRVDGARGSDVDDHSNGTIVEPRMYQLIRQSKPISDRSFEIEFLDAGAEAFSFTFG